MSICDYCRHCVKIYPDVDIEFCTICGPHITDDGCDDFEAINDFWKIIHNKVHKKRNAEPFEK